MCGIAGIIHLDGRPLVSGHDDCILENMGNAMAHRGPDDARSMLWNNVGFVFRRLSIVDIGGGRQPFVTHDDRIVAMVNGEIFNHEAIRRDALRDVVLQSHSDCEVIPHLYVQRGLDLFDPTNGMFAVALLDRREHRVVLARDRLGKKPLFYCIVDGGRTLVFGSELKALFAHPAVPRRFDWVGAMARYSDRDASAREMSSGFVGIERVPAAGLVIIDLAHGKVQVKHYWQLPERDAFDPARPAQWYVDQYRELLIESVRMRLMADVDYGMFLSGGIDSAVVAAIAAREKSFPTFSVLSRATLGSGDVQASSSLARQLGIPNHQVSFDHPGQRLTPDDWRRVLWSCEMHDITAEQLYKYFLHAFARERYPNLKVILLGQGSDEFNGGYTEWTLSNVAGMSPQQIAAIAHGQRWNAVGSVLGSIETGKIATDAGYLAHYGELLEQRVIDSDFVWRASGRSLDRTTWDLYVGYYRQNLDYHLWHEDRTAAAHSIENRLPFLDHRLVELTRRVPARLHAELFTDKAILRRAATGLVPAEIAARPKGPFFYGPDQHYAFATVYALLTANRGELIEQALAGSRCTDGPLNPDRFRSYVAEVGKDPVLARLEQLMFLVDMGVLADLADRNAPAPARTGALPVQEIALDSPDAIARLEAFWNAPVASPVPASAPSPDPTRKLGDAVPRFASGVSMLRIETTNMPAYKLKVEGRGEIDIASPTWAQFLAAMDGRRSVSQIVAQGKLNRALALKRLRKALEQGWVVTQPCAQAQDAQIRCERRNLADVPAEPALNAATGVRPVA